MLQGQGQWKGDIKVIKVKGQGHFAILLAKKGTNSTIYDLFVLKWGKRSEKSTLLLTKF